jgi:hypothetical protein
MFVIPHHVQDMLQYVEYRHKTPQRPEFHIFMETPDFDAKPTGSEIRRDLRRRDVQDRLMELAYIASNLGGPRRGGLIVFESDDLDDESPSPRKRPAV